MCFWFSGKFATFIAGKRGFPTQPIKVLKLVPLQWSRWSHLRHVSEIDRLDSHLMGPCSNPMGQLNFPRTPLYSTLISDSDGRCFFSLKIEDPQILWLTIIFTIIFLPSYFYHHFLYWKSPQSWDIFGVRPSAECRDSSPCEPSASLWRFLWLICEQKWTNEPGSRHVRKTYVNVFTIPFLNLK